MGVTRPVENPRTPCEPVEREVASGLGKHSVRGSQGRSLLVLNVEEKRPVTGPVGGERAAPRLTLTHARWEQSRITAALRDV